MASESLLRPVEDRDAWTADHCSIDGALHVVGRRATMLLLREAFYGAHRFDEFVRRAGFTEAVTAQRLRELVEHGLLERRPYRDSGQRRREEYYLTDMGRDLFPALLALMQWGDRWTQPDGGPIELTHAGCGAAIEAEVRCAEGHRVPLREIEARFSEASGRSS
jgi:DNA-binding HxlR family transcriptional regulator